MGVILIMTELRLLDCMFCIFLRFVYDGDDMFAFVFVAFGHVDSGVREIR